MVMQQLMDQNPLPMLLMRTVIQSLTMYPRLGGFVMNILSRLIMKQVCIKAKLPLVSIATTSPGFTLITRAGVEVSQGVGRLREMLPEDEAAVVQRPPAAPLRPAHQHV